MSTGSQFELRRPFQNPASGYPLSVSLAVMVILTIGFAVVGITGIRIPMDVQAAIYLFGMVAMNLPHGGYEHFSNLRRRTASFQYRYLGLFLGGIALFTVLFFVAPVAGLALAILVAVAKGGFGDVHALEALYGTEHIRSKPQRLLAATVRGGAVMFVPMVFWPETFYAFSEIIVNIFEPGALAAYGDILGQRLLIGGVYGTLLIAHLGLGYWYAAGTGSFVADAAETLLLVTYFAVVPVVIAVGLYFPLWYSARQVARTAAVDDTVDEPDTDSGLLAGLDSEDPDRIALISWGVLVAGSIVTFGLAATLWTLSPQPLGGAALLPGLVAFWSVFISIVALPHVVVGAWLDRERGIWYVP